MQKYPGIDYRQRPVSYFNDAGVAAALLRNVKGTARRALIRATAEAGDLDDVGDELIGESLEPPVRALLGLIHPSLMGGEYLPGYLRGEREIARIELRSVTRDVISVRARTSRGSVRYRIVDEYNTLYTPGCRSSRGPLTLGEFVRFLDRSRAENPDVPLPLAFNESNQPTPGARVNHRNFTSIRSDLYPQLHEHYERVFDDWAAGGFRRNVM